METDKLKSLIPGEVEIEINPTHSARISIKVAHDIDKVGLQRAASAMLRSFGLNGGRENFKDTPKRIMQMWSDWLAPQTLDLPVFTTPSTSSGMVLLRNHSAVTVCPHHLLPVEVTVDVGYLPQNHVVGISKLPRFVNAVCGSFMLQEHISEFIAQTLDCLLQPKGVVCRVRGTHGCMHLRGVRSTGDILTTTCTGVFLTDDKARNEFVQSVER